MTGPWSFDQAQDAMHAGSVNQLAAVDAYKNAVRGAAEAERVYRAGLAEMLVRVHAEGVAWSAAGDIARGRLAEEKERRDIAHGLKDALDQAAWRAASDRRDIARLAEWSMRRELAEHGGADDRLAFSTNGGHR